MYMAEYEVTGCDRSGAKVFHVAIEAVNETVAKLYATAHPQRTPDGADAVRNAVKTEARLRDRLVAIREDW
jgi:hypothetical protein